MATRMHLESVDRISNIPLVEKSVKRVEHLYTKVKINNRIFKWYFDTAEATLSAAYESIQPAVKLFESPIRQLDSVLCKSLDILEERIPLVYLPPEMMYWNTKEYMSDHLVKPVLKRADSVKQIRNAVLELPLTTYAADRIDGAFTAGDKFVDKYLMPLDQDQTDVTTISKDEAESLLNRMLKFYDNLQGISHTYLERLARYLSGSFEAEKIDFVSNIHGTSTATARSSAVPSTTARRRLSNNTQEPHINGLC